MASGDHEIMTNGKSGAAFSMRSVATGDTIKTLTVSVVAAGGYRFTFRMGRAITGDGVLTFGM